MVLKQHSAIIVGVLAAVLSFSSSPPLPGLPFLDADGMGRAYPKLQMYLPFILDIPPSPACLADNKSDEGEVVANEGEVAAISYCDSPETMEDVFRKEVTTKYVKTEFAHAQCVCVCVCVHVCVL